MVVSIYPTKSKKNKNKKLLGGGSEGSPEKKAHHFGELPKRLRELAHPSGRVYLAGMLKRFARDDLADDGDAVEATSFALPGMSVVEIRVCLF